jgi:hypothetical protein
MRIETTSRTLYQYSELSDAAQRAAREHVSAMNGRDWDGTDLYDDFEAVAERLGITFKTRVRDCQANRPGGARASKPITDPCIWYSGFSSQGDGACFEGRYAYLVDAPAKVRAYASTDATLHAIVDGLAELQVKYDNTLSATVDHSGHYYHKYSTRIEWLAQTADGNDDRDVDADDQTTATELLRDFMQWMYDQLEAAYDYQTSDACAVDTIEGNDWEFTETGELA